jgi:hypothetical protein
VTDRPWRRRAGIIALFTVLTGIMTWPQPLQLATHAADHQDTYFNMWRLRWIAHALATSPRDLFNGNQFYPEPRVMAFSDAVLVEGIIAAPLLWLRVPPVLVLNLVLLGAIVASAVGMFTLARHLSGSATGAVVAGIIFAFAPYRFEHYMHLELQWIVWAPWAFWALQRTLETGAAKYGALTGVFIALQMMSSVYYGLFLALLIAIVGSLQLIAQRGRMLVAQIRSLAIGAVIAAVISGVYAVPYSAASARVGVRAVSEISMFSARPRDYQVATESNFLYGREGTGGPERRLFPGILAPVLGLVGLLLIAPGSSMIAYAVGLAVAFELSLGMHGELYPFLHDHVSVFAGLRAPARASVFCLLFVGVLAAQGCAAIETYFKGSGETDTAPASAAPRRSRVVRLAFASIVCGVLLLEYWVAPLPLVPFDNTPPPLYRWLAQLPRGVVAEFPMPFPYRLPGYESRYIYMSTFHWMPLLNGYSGYYPPNYLHRLTPLSRFPDENSIDWLRTAGVRYVIVHSGGYSSEERTLIIEALVRNPTLTHVGDFKDGWGDGTVFRLR